MNNNPLLLRAKGLKLHGAILHWNEIEHAAWLPELIQWEEDERQTRGLERRFKQAKIGRFKPLVEFDWNWPKKCDREAIEDLMQLEFLKEAINPIFIGSNSVGKTTIARNIAHQAVLKGHSVLFITASDMLTDLSSQDGKLANARRLKYYEQPSLLIIDELGYMSYADGYADLLFAVVSRRYEKKSTLVTTNKPFNEWGESFANASCLVSIIDRLVHHAEIIAIEADSFRLKDSEEEAAKRKQARKVRLATRNRKIKEQ